MSPAPTFLALLSLEFPQIGNFQTVHLLGCSFPAGSHHSHPLHLYSLVILCKISLIKGKEIVMALSYSSSYDISGIEAKSIFSTCVQNIKYHI